jgi:hypothetical protein
VGDSSNVDAALVLKLMNDATLMNIVPHGVFFDIAPQGDPANPVTKFVIVTQQAHEDTAGLNQTDAYEQFTYLVKAVTSNTSGADVKAAADRIHTLLHHGTLTITGYTLMAMFRSARIRYTELDDESDLRWQHRGGLYEVHVSPS